MGDRRIYALLASTHYAYTVFKPALSNAAGNLLLHVWGGHSCPPALEV